MVSAVFLSRYVNFSDYRINKGSYSARVSVDESGAVSYPEINSGITMEDAIKALKAYRRNELRRFIVQVRTNPNYPLNIMAGILSELFAKRNSHHPTVSPPFSSDTTAYCRDLGYSGIEPVIVQDGKVISHNYIDWFEFCESLRESNKK